MVDKVKRNYDFVIPPALPPLPPRTFVSPIPTKAALAERAAEAEADAAKRRGKEVVPLAIRFLRLLESRSVQHNSTTPTVFHRMLRRRNSNPNLHFVGYRDVNPMPEARLKCEMLGTTDVVIQVEWNPPLFGSVEVLNDMDITWSSTLEERVEPDKKDNESDHDTDDEAEANEMTLSSEAASSANKRHPADLDMVALMKATRDMAVEEIEARKEAEALAFSKLSRAEKHARQEAEKIKPTLILDKKDGAANIILIPKDQLQARGWVHKIEYKAIHRPSLRITKAYTRLRVAPKGSIWKVQFDEPPAFKENIFSPDQSNNINGSDLNSDSDNTDGDGDESDGDESDGPPDPFADVNKKAELGQYETADSFNENQSVVTGIGYEQPGHIPGTCGSIVRGKYENDRDWLRRLEEELDAAIRIRKETEKRKAEEAGKQARMVEETKSVFDQDSQKVSDYTKQFLAQEVADEKLAVSKLENKWNGPKQNDLKGSVLNLSGRALERDDMDALGWILRRNWGIRTLDLSRCAITDDECKSLLDSLKLNTVLKKLDMRHTRLTDQGAKMCMELLTETSGMALKLEELDLRHCRQMGKEAGRHYHEHLDSLQPSLRYLNGMDLNMIRTVSTKLDLSGIPLGVPEVNFLSLRIFNRRTRLNDDSSQLLFGDQLKMNGRSVFGESGSLDDGSMSMSMGGEEGDNSILLNDGDSKVSRHSHFESQFALKELILKDCGLNPEGCKIICDSLSVVGEIEVLDLSENALFLEGGNYIAKLVTSTSSVKKLRLIGCKLQWAPEMVEAQRIARSKGIKETKLMSKKNKSSNSNNASAQQYKAFDPSEDLDPSALFVLADIAKRLKQLEECALSDDDALSEAARQIEQSLAINRALAYNKHVDLVQSVIPPVSEPEHSKRLYELTLDVDSRFLLKEKLLHLKSVGVVLDESLHSPTPPPVPPPSLSGGDRGASIAQPSPPPPPSSQSSNATKRGIGSAGKSIASSLSSGVSSAMKQGSQLLGVGTAANQPKVSQGGGPGFFGESDGYYLH